MCCTYVTVLWLASAVFGEKKEARTLTIHALKQLDMFFFLLISRESHRGWSPETPGERKVGLYRFIVVTPADVKQAGFFFILSFHHRTHRAALVSWFGLVSKLEEDLAGCGPTAFAERIKVLFGERCVQDPSERGNGWCCRHEWSYGRPPDFKIY